MKILFIIFMSVMTFTIHADTLSDLKNSDYDLSQIPDMTQEMTAAPEATRTALGVAFQAIPARKFSNIPAAKFVKIPGALFSSAQLMIMADMETSDSSSLGVRRLNREQIRMIDYDELAAIPVEQLLKFKDDQVKEFTADQLVKLPKERWDNPAMKAKLDKIPAATFSGMTPAQKAEFWTSHPNAEAILSAEQKAALGPKPAATPVASTTGDTAVAPPIPNPNPTPDPAAPVAAGPDDASDYNIDTCEWVQDLPRRIVKVRGSLARTSCGASGASNSCVGYVSCNQRGKTTGVKTIRMSTCSANLCGNSDAKKCTKDPGRISIQATGDDNQTIQNSSVRGALQQ